MITMTPHALSVVRMFTAHPRLAMDSGVRIVRERDDATLKVKPVKHREEQDVVVEQSGGRLYVDRTAWPRLRDKVLDARTDARGRVEFLVRASARDSSVAVP